MTRAATTPCSSRSRRRCRHASSRPRSGSTPCGGSSTEYFDGKRQTFELKLDWRLTRGFFQKILRETARVRFGELATYKQMAEAAGSPRAVRAAGNALGSNPIPIVVPCHRIVRTGGKLGGYGGELGPYIGGPGVKQRLLELEGALDEHGRPRV